MGRRLRRLRDLAGVTQAHVAAQMVEEGVDGIYPQTIVRIENGSRALKWAEAVALSRILGFDLAELSAEADETVTRDRFALGVISNFERKLRDLHMAHTEVDLIRQNLREISTAGLSPAVARKVKAAIEVAGG